MKTTLTGCTFCGNVCDCILVKRRDQPDKILKTRGNVFLCDSCLVDCRNRDEIRRDQFQADKPYVFTKDLMSEYKF